MGREIIPVEEAAKEWFMRHWKRNSQSLRFGSGLGARNRKPNSCGRR
jgi:hypothetical protein